MLKELHIHNIILIEEAHISFGSGLNILSGETGSGKSAIMQSIGLCLGDRAEVQLIRKGCDKGFVEAVFEDFSLEILQALRDGGIEVEQESPLVIKREITQSNKNRIFINHQAASLSFLKHIGALLVKVIGQGQSHTLYTLETHRSFVDVFADLTSLITQFQVSFDRENQLRKEHQNLIDADTSRLREIDIYLRELQELEEAQIKEGEEEELFREFSLLSHSEEISRKLDSIHEALCHENHSILSSLRMQKPALESISSFDPRLGEVLETYHSAYMDLQEVAHSLNNYRSHLYFDETRLKEIDARLALIDKLKRKFGPTTEEVIRYQAEIREKLKKLENREIEIETLAAALQSQIAESDHLAKQLSDSRKQAACRFSKAITSHLKELNMPRAEFSIELALQKRTREGDDHIEFFLSPNTGERCVPLREGVSGGEISRVLIALQVLLAGKENQSTLIFDEVDASIGGETATLIGRKLKEISLKHQVICITHFPQVALHADCHFQISKQEHEGRTLTQVTYLNAQTRRQELNRMAGKI